MRMRRRPWISLAAAGLAAGFAANAAAYVVNSYTSGGETLYLKWGVDNHAGTPGGIVYWSFVPAGTSGSAYCEVPDGACPGTSVDSIMMEISPGGGFAPRLLTDLEGEITAMMDAWSAYSGIQFVKLASDSGVPINDPTAFPRATGQIRIGVFAFDTNGGEGAAVGYSPPPNGGTGAGNILFNANAYFQDYDLPEGSSYDNTYAPNDFQSLMLHELGHTVGLEHTANDGTCPVMCVESECLYIIKRQLQPDDIAGVQFLYGEIFTNGFE
jgi:hypothetical protein